MTPASAATSSDGIRKECSGVLPCFLHPKCGCPRLSHSIVAAELRYGAAKLGSARLTSAVEEWLAGFDVQPWPLDATHHYARIRNPLETAGQPTRGMDLMTAAHALAEDSVLITANAREVHRIPELAVEAWPLD